MSYGISVRAGPGAEDDDVYRYVDYPIPKGINSIDDPVYSSLTRSVLNKAAEIVRLTSKNITLKLSVEEIFL